MIAPIHEMERPYAHQSTSLLLRGVAENVRDLVGQEISGLAAEVKQEVAQARHAVLLGAVGGGLLAVGSILLAIAAAELLALVIPRWGAYAIIAGAFLLAGIVALVIGRKKTADVSALPRQTLRSAKRDARWIKNETISAVRSSRNEMS